MSKSLMKLTTAVAFAFCTALPVAAQDEMNADTVVATVNGTEITLGHMLLAREALPQQYQTLPADQLWDGILNQLVQQEVLRQDKSAEETRNVRIALENERRSLLATEVIRKVADAAISDAAVQAAYEAQFLNADPEMEFNASHILVDTEEAAQALIDEINGGADFVEVAKAKSTGPSGANGGSLGWFSKGMMVEPFQVAVETLEVGALSAPVQTQFGWHVIKLNESRAKEAPTLDAVRADLVQTLQRDAVTKHIDALLDGAEVTRTEAGAVDPSVLGNSGLLDE